MGLLANTAQSFVVGAWDLTSFLNNAREQATTWGNAFLMLLGVISIVIAGYQIITGLISHGKKQVNWGVTILLMLVGGALFATGFSLMSEIAKGGTQTIKDLGGAGLWLAIKSGTFF